MWATDRSSTPRRSPAVAQGGVAAVEFALIALVFFGFVFGVMETARLMYVLNTVQEVTRRAAAAAAHVDPNMPDRIAAVRQYAVFRDTPGALLLAPPITDDYIRITYLNSNLALIPRLSWPESAARNREICMRNPNAANCIRFVQAAICRPDVPDSCTAPTSRALLPVVDWGIPLHMATTIVMAESLGYVDGALP